MGIENAQYQSYCPLHSGKIALFIKIYKTEVVFIATVYSHKMKGENDQS